MERMKIRPEDALQFHLEPHPGKLEVVATVPMTTQRDLSLAYTPGVAAPCLAIEREPDDAYAYTSKGNLVAQRPPGELHSQHHSLPCCRHFHFIHHRHKVPPHHALFVHGHDHGPNWEDEPQGMSRGEK